MSDRLAGRTAIVTGSSQGIGKAIAERFAVEGANVVTNSRALERATATAEGIRDAGGKAYPVEADISDRDGAQHLVDTARDEFGRIDIMVNNAGVTAIAPALEMDPDEWRHVVDVNLTGVFFGCQAAGNAMIEGDYEKQIINISSIFGSIGVQGRAPYNATKGGVDSLTRCLAVELAEHGVQVNALAPGFIKTAMDEQTKEADDVPEENVWPRYGYDDRDIHNRTPMDRYGTTDEMSTCALFLAAGDHYMTGEVLTADGGWLAFGWGSKELR